MANVTDTISEIMKIDGAKAVSIVDASTGMMLGAEGKGLDLEYASAGNTELYHAKQKIMKSLNINEKIEDFLITLDTQYHVLVPSKKDDTIFIYAVFMKADCTLALARRKLTELASTLSI